MDKVRSGVMGFQTVRRACERTGSGRTDHGCAQDVRASKVAVRSSLGPEEQGGMGGAWSSFRKGS